MKSKKKVIGVLFIIVLIVALAGLAYLYFFTDMFKTPEEMFYKYLEKASKNESDYSYQDMLEKLKTNQTSSYKQNATAQIDIKAKGTDYTSRINQVTYDEISKLKLKIESQNVPNEEKASINIKAEHNDEEVTEISLVKNSEMYGIKSEFLNDKYIAVENKNLKSLIRKIGLETANIPDQLEFVDLYDLLYIDQKEQDRIVNTYKDIIKNNISTDKYQKVDNVIQKVNGQDLNTTVYALSINEKEFNSLIIKLLERLEQDEATLGLIVDKANKISNINIIKSYYNEDDMELTIDSLKENIEDKIEELQVLYTDEKSMVEVVLYVSDNEIARIEFKRYNEIQFAADFYKKDDKNHIDFFEGSSYSELEKTLEIEYKTEKDVTDGSVKIIDGYKETKLDFNITKNEENNSKVYKFNIETEDLTVGLTIETETEYTEDIEIENLNDKNSIILNNMSKSELEELFAGIQTRFQRTLVNKMVGLGLIDANTVNVLDTQM